MTTEALTWIRTGNKLTVILPSGQPKTVTEGDSVYETVLEAIKQRNWESIPDLLDPKAAIYNFSDGKFEVIDGIVHVEGKAVPNGLSKKIIAFSKEDLPYLPLLNFWNKLKNNPSWRNVQGLFDFLELKGYPITEDGNIIAYKGIRADWTDRHTGTVSNKIGETPKVPRNEVNDDPSVECQFGLHVADWSFASSYSGADGHMIMVSVNPEHVVSMPNAYQFTKMRVCEYTVLKEVFNEEKGNLYKNTVSSLDNSSNDNYDEENEDDDEYCRECDESIGFCNCY